MTFEQVNSKVVRVEVSPQNAVLARRGPAAIYRAEGSADAIVARSTFLADALAARRGRFDEVWLLPNSYRAALLARAGHQLDVPALHRLVAVVDGTVVNSLIEADPDPRAAARAALLAELTT